MKRGGNKGRRVLNPNLSLNMATRPFPGVNLNGTNLDIGHTLNESHSNFENSTLLSKLNEPSKLREEFDFTVHVESMVKIFGNMCNVSRAQLDESKKSLSSKTREYNLLKKELEKKDAMLRNSKMENSMILESVHKKKNREKEMMEGQAKRIKVLEKVIKYLKTRVEEGGFGQKEKGQVSYGVNYFYYYRPKVVKGRREVVKERETMDKENVNKGGGVSTLKGEIETRMDSLKQKMLELKGGKADLSTGGEWSHMYEKMRLIVDALFGSNMEQYKNYQNLRRSVENQLVVILGEYQKKYVSLKEGGIKDKERIVQLEGLNSEVEKELKKEREERGRLEEEVRVGKEEISKLEKQLGSKAGNLEYMHREMVRILCVEYEGGKEGEEEREVIEGVVAMVEESQTQREREIEEKVETISKQEMSIMMLQRKNAEKGRKEGWCNE
jgi:hypothetical protein